MADSTNFADLNDAQRAAADYGCAGGRAEAGPLLIIAGAGSGKTTTLAHRVARLILSGADPRRLLMLTFTRRAAAEMIRRASSIVSAARVGGGGRSDGAPRSPTTRGGAGAAASRGAAADEGIAARAGSAGGAAADVPAEGAGAQAAAAGAALSKGVAARVEWAGTFHAVANRLLRFHASSVGLDPSFTVLDRSDSADLIDIVRHELGLAEKKSRFPKKATCLAIYSHAVNSQRSLEHSLEAAFPWCEAWADELRRLFAAYTEAKGKSNVLDYDDLLLYWYHLMSEPALAESVARRFDHVLVDEYQDTNVLQSGILLALKPEGRGLTVVGDDAQAIYSFRAATVRNILDFPTRFAPPAEVVTLEQNYRSTQPILDACNAVIEGAAERFTKNLFSTRQSAQRPILVTVEDEDCQVEYVVASVLAHREAGIDLHRQAVLFRASHHSDRLEVELARRNIPFVKYGGLKFLEAAHVKDLLCVLRWAENPRDAVAAFRVLQILPGIGPGTARRAVDYLQDRRFDLGALGGFRAPAAAAGDWPGLSALLARLGKPDLPWPGQIGMVRQWYQPHLERLYDYANIRAGDIEQLEQIATGYSSRERFLTELTLDPPQASGDEAGPPLLDEDYLILSTIHSAKGQEWDAVYVLNAADGCIPSDMSTGNPEQIEEERRLLYVAMTRARDHLHIVHPLRFFVRQQRRYGDEHVYTPRSRFLPASILDRFEQLSHGRSGVGPDAGGGDGDDRGPRVDVASRLAAMWRKPGTL